jgi:hypothetical protein
MTTTWTAIADAVTGAMRGITPTSLSGQTFRLYTQPADFRDWASDNPAASFRIYEVRDLHTYEPPEVSNSTEELRRGEFEVVVAYPLQMGLYDQGSRGNRRDLDTWIHEDEKSIRKALRHASGIYPSAASVMFETYDLTELEAIAFSTFTFPFTYYRSMS